MAPGMSKVRSPNLVIIGIDRAVLITVSCQTCRGSKCIAPDDVVGRIYDAVVVVIACDCNDHGNGPDIGNLNRQRGGIGVRQLIERTELKGKYA